ncbi:hypothetical protein DFP72DRAFT_889810 [Ephemerocybe angulata]|uniref:Peptidase metallopeptidase domain-containing protein n=1 Tax=Ephemerocybe angulata TaxID=980116 RepID=A0A8H6I517_9AGAR|nr:hypothetical protein DFP72DRAFT_889810 [Tulosesus angulatus]
MPVFPPLVYPPRADAVMMHAPRMHDGVSPIVPFTRRNGLWDNGARITCGFSKHRGQGKFGGGELEEHRFVKRVAREWEKCANVKFIFVDQGDRIDEEGEEEGEEGATMSTTRSQTHIEGGKEGEDENEEDEVPTHSFKPLDAVVRIYFAANGVGSWTYLAGDIESIPKYAGPTMNITPPLTQSRGDITHQFGHVLGFLDEHKNPKMKDVLEWKMDDITKHFWGWNEEEPVWSSERTVKRWEAYKDNQVGAVLPVDLDSVMMYADPLHPSKLQFSNGSEFRFHLPKEFTEQGLEVPPHETLSPLDKAYAFLTYPYFDGDQAPEGAITFSEALDVAKITGEVRERFVAKYAVRDWRGMREELVGLGKVKEHN